MAYMQANPDLSAVRRDSTDAPLPCLIADRVYDGDAFRTWRAQQGIEAVIPPGAGRTNSQPRAPERYPACNAVRGIGGIKRGRHMTTRYDKHAHCRLNSLYLTTA